MIHNKWAYLGTGGHVGYVLHAFHTFLQAFSLDCSTSSPVLSLLCNSDIFLPPWFFFLIYLLFYLTLLEAFAKSLHSQVFLTLATRGKCKHKPFNHEI